MHGALPLPGAVVWIRRRRWRVDRARRDRHVVRLDVSARDRRLTFLSPFDRVLTRVGATPPRRVRAQEALARLAGLVARTDDLRLPGAAIAAVADILPHQLEPVMAMLSGRTRVLVADDVGLGKTVQAGLVIAELLRRDLASRVLVLVPGPLRDQWTDELTLRFGLTCLAGDRVGLDDLARAGAVGDNPWRRSGVWLASPDFLKQPHVTGALPVDPWDLVVIDEAHAMCGDSARFEACQAIARRSRRVLLLTATPHDGDAARFERLISLGCLEGGRQDLTAFRRTRASMGPRPPRRVRWHRVTLSDAERRVLDALRGFERIVATRSAQSDQALLLLSVFRKRALSTMSALATSIARRLSWLGEPGPDTALDWAQPRLGFDDEGDDIDRAERDGLTAHSGLGAAQERSWLRRIRTLADEASRQERKVERLVSLLHRTHEPVVVFTEFRDSLDLIQRRLSFSRPVSVLHGGQDAAARRQQLRQFLNGTTSVLLATDVAGQGLNLQSRARWVISLELPWNPARLEQRIGRVDRIGQTRRTHLTLLMARDDAETGMLLRLSARVLAAQRAFGEALLDTVVPPAPEVRAALIFGRPDPPEDAPGTAVRLARRWRRPAVCAAAALIRRRGLARLWQSPAPLGGGAVWTDAGRVQTLIPAGATHVALYSVPVLDEAGELVERRLVPIAVGAGRAAASRAGAVMSLPASAVRAVVARALAARLRIVMHRARLVTGRLEQRERELDAADEWTFAMDEVQPGLFDLRDARDFERRQGDHARWLAASERLLDDLSSRQRLRLGQPVLEIVLSRRS